MGESRKKRGLGDFSRKIILSVLAAFAPFTIANKVKANIAPLKYTNDTWSQYVHNEEQHKPQNGDLESDLLGLTKDLQNYIANVRHNNRHYGCIDNRLDRHLKPNLLAVFKNSLIQNPPTNYYFGEGDWIDNLMIRLLDKDIYNFIEKTKYNLLGGFGNPWGGHYKARGDLFQELVGLYVGIILKPPYLDDKIDASEWVDNLRIRWLDKGKYEWFDNREYKFLGWVDFPFGFMNHSAILEPSTVVFEQHDNGYQGRDIAVIPESSTVVLFGLGALAILTPRKRKREN